MYKYNSESLVQFKSGQSDKTKVPLVPSYVNSFNTTVESLTAARTPLSWELNLVIIGKVILNSTNIYIQNIHTCFQDHWVGKYQILNTKTYRVSYMKSLCSSLT